LRKTPFFAENCQKSQKIVIMTSTPGHPGPLLIYFSFKTEIILTDDGRARPSISFLYFTVSYGALPKTISLRFWQTNTHYTGSFSGSRLNYIQFQFFCPLCRGGEKICPSNIFLLDAVLRTGTG
jgi:hypothetical protein